jgi:hypothetical protein
VLANDVSTSAGAKLVVTSNTGNVTVTPDGQVTLKFVP